MCSRVLCDRDVTEDVTERVYYREGILQLPPRMCVDVHLYVDIHLYITFI